jgi:Ca2+-binding EF-hand superfamily protein
MKSPEQAAFKVILVIAVLIAVAVLPFVARADSHAPAPPSFEKFDADGDGFISEEEFVQKRAERMAARAQEGRQMKGAANAPSFSDFDSNGDGKLDVDEFTSGRDAHKKSMQERHGGQGGGKHHRHGGGMKMPTFADLDLDGNGCIDAEEFARHQASHHPKMKGQARESEE